MAAKAAISCEIELQDLTDYPLTACSQSAPRGVARIALLVADECQPCDGIYHVYRIDDIPDFMCTGNVHLLRFSRTYSAKSHPIIRNKKEQQRTQ